MTYPMIDPIAFYLFSWPVHWYGLMYLFGFVAGWGLLSWRLREVRRNSTERSMTQEELSDIVFFTALGAIIGGRVGYILFYQTQVFITEPMLIFQTWKGGMSFHGGLIGVLIALFFCARKLQVPMLALSDLIAPVVPIGLAAGRLGNFINGELWGKPTSAAWGVIFPNAGNMPRHPSQLYEMVLEGIVLFFILWFYSKRPRPVGAVSGLFALGYAVFRFIIEFYREPDANIGYLAFGWLTEGQLLSIPLALVGVALMVYAYGTSRGKK